MNERNDRVESAFQESFEQRAGQAPAADGLLDRVRQGRRSHRRRLVVTGSVTLAAVATAAVVVLAGGLLPAPTDSGGPDPSAANQTQVTERKPSADWRTESYHGVEVDVPASWAHGTTGAPPCLVGADAEPYVGRPGAVYSIGCGVPVPDLDKRQPYLWFDSPEKPGVRQHGHDWVSETRNVAGQRITVFADDDELRSEIFESVYVLRDVDSNGCRVQHEIADDPATRPDPDPGPGPGGLATVGDVRSISVCGYTLGRPGDDPIEYPLRASSKLTAGKAQRLVDEIVAAPKGSGPNATPGSCLEKYGEQVMLLDVHGSERSQEVVVRYSGCYHHGTDDGAVERQLTKGVLLPLFDGPHEPTMMDGSVGDLIHPHVNK